METQMVSFYSFRFWKYYGVTMRPYLLFVSGIAGMAGFALVGGNAIRIVAAGIAFFLSYGFGQALTDCFQTDTDSISSPYRPLVRGVISRNQVLGVSIAGLSVCCILLALLNPRTILLGVFCVIGLATYTFFKRRWWGGPFYNAGIVAVLPIMGFLSAMGYTSDGGHGEVPRSLVPLVFSIFFAYADFVLTGYFKDISADMKSGYNTFVVKYGWIRAAITSDIFAFLALVSAGCVLQLNLRNSLPVVQFISILLFLLAMFSFVNGHRIIHIIRDEHLAHRSITHIVRGFIVILLAQISAFQPSWIPFLLLYWAAFELVLRSRPEKTQV